MLQIIFMKDFLKESIANESKTENASNLSASNRAEVYETYTDGIDGFSLQYPVDWKVDDSDSPSLFSFYKGNRGDLR